MQYLLAGAATMPAQNVQKLSRKEIRHNKFISYLADVAVWRLTLDACIVVEA